MSTIDDLLVLTAASARAAGRAVLRCAGASNLHARSKGTAGPVTDADLASQAVLIDALTPVGYAILSEEQIDDHARTTHDRVWIVDPLDGTKDFLEGRDEYCVMVALTECGRPVLGAVYLPAMDILFTAAAGRGAFMTRGGEPSIPIAIPSPRECATMKMLVSRHHRLPVELAVAKQLDIGCMVVCGSAGVKACRIATGEADIYVNSSDRTGEWDTAAAECIVQEAGGIVTDMDGSPLTYNKKEPRNPRGFVIANPAAHDRVLAALRECPRL